jgi:multiple sugar transport system ATP-binding protein
VTIPTPEGDFEETPRRVVAGIRPEDIAVDGSDDVSLDARVTEIEYQGDGNFVFLETDDVEPVERGDADGDDGEDDRNDSTVSLTVRTPVSVRPSPGESVTLTVDAEDVYLFDAESGDAIRTSPTADVRPAR